MAITGPNPHVMVYTQEYFMGDAVCITVPEYKGKMGVVIPDLARLGGNSSIINEFKSLVLTYEYFAFCCREGIMLARELLDEVIDPK